MCLEAQQALLEAEVPSLTKGSSETPPYYSCGGSYQSQGKVRLQVCDLSFKTQRQRENLIFFVVRSDRNVLVTPSLFKTLALTSTPTLTVGAVAQKRKASHDACRGHRVARLTMRPTRKELD